MSKKFREKVLQGSGFSNKKFECDYGLKLLKKMGWTEGNGLGREEKGMTSCIQVTKRDETIGLGVDKKVGFKWNDNWWENTFNDALKNIKLPAEHLDLQDNQSSESEDDLRGRKIKKVMIFFFHKKYFAFLFKKKKKKNCFNIKKMFILKNLFF